MNLEAIFRYSVTVIQIINCHKAKNEKTRKQSCR